MLKTANIELQVTYDTDPQMISLERFIEGRFTSTVFLTPDQARVLVAEIESAIEAAEAGE